MSDPRLERPGDWEGDECGHEWDPRPGETITYRTPDGGKVTRSVTGPHRCIKLAEHVDDITDNDHRCCCGASD